MFVVEGLDAIEVITLFVEDLNACKKFYTDVFGLEVLIEDADSAVLKLDNIMINLLTSANAPTLVEPVTVGGASAGPRALYTIRVADVRATAEKLREQGVTLLNGPTDRPWGRRTAAFADPAGNAWEIAEIID